MAKDKNANGSSFSVNFTIKKETKGAVCYAEIDAAGNIVEDFAAVKIGTLYIRKTAFAGRGEFPKVLVLEVRG